MTRCSACRTEISGPFKVSEQYKCSNEACGTEFVGFYDADDDDVFLVRAGHDPCCECRSEIPGPFNVLEQYNCPNENCGAEFVGFYDLDEDKVCLVIEKRGNPLEVRGRRVKVAA